MSPECYEVHLRVLRETGLLPVRFCAYERVVPYFYIQ
jgi:hypothetical protein